MKADNKEDIFLNGEKKEKVLACDLDGVLAHYEGWKGENIIGKPIKGGRELLEELKRRDWKIVIFTTRFTVEVVKHWLKENKIPFDKINENYYPLKTSGKIIADVYLDDRAITFNGIFSKILLDKIDKFKPYYLEEGEILSEGKDSATITKGGKQ